MFHDGISSSFCARLCVCFSFPYYSILCICAEPLIALRGGFSPRVYLKWLLCQSAYINRERICRNSTKRQNAILRTFSDRTNYNTASARAISLLVFDASEYVGCFSSAAFSRFFFFVQRHTSTRFHRNGSHTHSHANYVY